MPNRTVLHMAAALALMAPLSACDRTKADAEAAVRDSLKDPDSAKFGDFYYNQKTEKGCLTVNAKNSMGGYIGDQEAYVRKSKGSWSVGSIAEGSKESCQKYFADEAS